MVFNGKLFKTYDYYDNKTGKWVGMTGEVSLIYISLLGPILIKYYLKCSL